MCLSAWTAPGLSHINHQSWNQTAWLLQALQDVGSSDQPVGDIIYRGSRDRLQTSSPVKSSWQENGLWLHPDVVQSIWGLFSMAEMDLFTSKMSTHCPLWHSLTENISPLGQDALAHEWPVCLLLTFPPLHFAICFFWWSLLASQERIPLLHQHCSGTPWCLPSKKNLLSQLGFRPVLPLTFIYACWRA